jgi:hypothetical protein
MVVAFSSVTLMFAHVDWSIKNNISRRPRVILDPAQTMFEPFSSKSIINLEAEQNRISADACYTILHYTARAGETCTATSHGLMYCS